MSHEAACDVVLTREQLHYLGRYVAGAPAACSPFRGVRSPEELPAPALEGEGGLAAGAALAPLVRRMALLNRVLDLRAGRATSGASPVAADIVVVRADSGALLLWEAEADGSLRWVTPSADEAKQTAMRLLTRADALARGH